MMPYLAMTSQQKPTKSHKTYKGGKIRRTAAGGFAADITIGKNRRRKSFATKIEAEKFIDGLTATNTRLGAEAFDGLDIRQAQDARDAYHILEQAGSKITLMELAENHVQSKTGAGSDLLIGKLYDLYIKELEARRRERTVQDKRSRLDPFAQAFENVTLASLKATDVDRWLTDTNHAGRNLRNDQIAIQSLFNWVDKYTATKARKERNPTIHWSNDIAVFPSEDWEAPDAPEVGTVSNEIARDVLLEMEQRDPQSALVLALGLLAGLRTSEIVEKGGLLWENIDLEERELTVTAIQSKTKHGRTVHINDVLLTWLLKYQQDTGRVGRRFNAFRKHRKVACEKVGVDWPHNAARHTFASNLCKLHGERRAADALGHVGSVDVLLDHYRGVMQTKAKAKSYFEILKPSPHV
jgi:integrase